LETVVSHFICFLCGVWRLLFCHFVFYLFGICFVWLFNLQFLISGGRRGRDRMVESGFTTTYAISAYHH